MSAPPLIEIITRSREETERLGERVGLAALPGDVIALWGELGAGKTTFTRGLARGLRILATEVTSPTFVIVHEHEGGRVPFVHVDLYRLSPRDTASTGWDEGISAGAVTAIEWPDRVEKDLPADRLDVRLAHAGEDQRTIRFEPHGVRAALLAEAAT